MAIPSPIVLFQPMPPRRKKDPPSGLPGSGLAEGSLANEGHAVRALLHRGIGLVGADLDALERAVVFVAAVVPALGNGALDAMVGMAITAHERFLLCLISSLVCAAPPGKIMEIPSIFKLTAPENPL